MKKVQFVLAGLLILAMLLSACTQTATPTEEAPRRSR